MTTSGISCFIISLDGVHCYFHEEKHPTLAKNPKLCSYKFKGPGLAYELALHLWEPRLVRLNGPFDGSTHDRAMYQSELQAKIPAGKKVVVDNGYRDKADPKLAPPNSHDSEELRTFKARAKMRQESFNKRMKRFKCIDQKVPTRPRATQDLL